MVPAAMGVILLIGFWVLLAITLLIVALSGGPRQATARVRQSPSPRGRRQMFVALTVVCVVFGAAIPVWVIASAERSAKAGHADLKLTPSEKRGRQHFGERCNQCHTLSASQTIGRVGPNLDDVVGPLSGADPKQTYENKRKFVLDAILMGRARGKGTMPARLLEGMQAEDVAAYVARVAGRQ